MACVFRRDARLCVKNQIEPPKRDEHSGVLTGQMEHGGLIDHDRAFKRRTTQVAKAVAVHVRRDRQFVLSCYPPINYKKQGKNEETMLS